MCKIKILKVRRGFWGFLFGMAGLDWTGLDRRNGRWVFGWV